MEKRRSSSAIELKGIETSFKHYDLKRLKELLLSVEKLCRETSDRIPNLVILACKHNKLDCLKYLLSKRAVDIVEKVNGSFFRPDERDSRGYDAFYYAQLSFNTDLVDHLIKHWPGDKVRSDPQLLDSLLSSAYQSLNVNNIDVPHQMQRFVLTKLVDLNLRVVSPSSELHNHEYIEDRIALLSDCAARLGQQRVLDEKCLFLLTFVAKNISVLKTILKTTYDRMPWEEMEFMCVFLVHCYNYNDKLFQLLFLNILTLKNVRTHLNLFVGRLKGIDIRRLDPKSMSTPPRMEREEAVSNILAEVPAFSRLYEDYRLVRDVFTLKKINDCLSAVSHIDPQEKEGQLMIFRALEVTGAHLTDSLESPKLSRRTADLLKICCSESTRRMMVSSSEPHSRYHSYNQRITLHSDPRLFSSLQKDLSTLQINASNALLQLEKQLFSNILTDIVKSVNVSDELRDIIFALIHVPKLVTKEIEKNLSPPDQQKQIINNLLTKLGESDINKGVLEMNLMKKIKTAINKKNDDAYSTYFKLTKSQFMDLAVTLASRKDINHVEFKMFKKRAQLCLTEMQHLGLKSHEFDSLRTQINKLFSLLFNKNKGSDRIYDILDLFRDYFLCFGCKKDVSLPDSVFDVIREELDSPLEQNHILQQQKNDIVKSISTELNGMLEKIDKLVSYGSTIQTKSKERLSFGLQVLLLDLLSFLDLESNVLSLDNSYFVLTGQSLRNHLALSNDLVDILMNESTLFLVQIFAAKGYTQIYSSSAEREYRMWKSGFKPKLELNRNLLWIDKKLNLFSALEKELADVKKAIAVGGEVLSRDFYLRTCLHLAAKKDRSETCEYLLSLGLTIEPLSQDEQSVLHFAAQSGSTRLLGTLLVPDLDCDEIDTMGRSPLHLAVRSGNFVATRLLVNQEADPFILNNKGESPLHVSIQNGNVKQIDFIRDQLDGNGDSSLEHCLYMACTEGRVDLVKHFISEGASVNFKPGSGPPLIHASCITGNYEIVNILLSHGAHVDFPWGNMRPLTVSCMEGHNNIVELLLQRGANVNGSNTENNTDIPIAIATCFGYNDVVTTLIKFRANLYSTKESLLSLAVKNNHLEVTKTLINRGVGLAPGEEFSLVYKAVENGSVAMLELLFSNGLSVVGNCFNTTPLHLASSLGLRDVVHLLIKHGAQVNSRDNKGDSPLHSAARSISQQVVDILIDNNAEVNSVNFKHQTPLHVAAINDNIQVAQELLRRGANLNANCNDCTPLQLACSMGHHLTFDILFDRARCFDHEKLECYINSAVRQGDVRIVQKLLEKVKNIRLPIVQNKVILNAIMNDQSDILQMSLDKGFDAEMQGLILMVAIFKGYKRMTKMLLNRGLKVNSFLSRSQFESKRLFDDNWKQIWRKSGFREHLFRMNPLLLASWRGESDIIGYLLRSEGSLTVTDNSGRSPLHLATLSGNLESVRCLVEHGADLNAKDDIGDEPIHLAAKDGLLDTIKYFLSAGVSSVVTGSKDWTVLHYAAAFNSVQVIKLMVEKDVDLSPNDSQGYTPLEIAATKGHHTIFKLLLDSGCIFKFSDLASFVTTGDKQILSMVKNTEALFEAVMRKDLRATKFAISGGAVVKAIHPELGSALHRTCEKGSLEIARLLIDAGCDLNARIEGSTPLHLAVKSSNYDLVLYLIVKGAHYNSLSDSGKTPRDLCKNTRIKQLLTCLTSVFDQVTNGSLGVLNYLKRIKNEDILKAIKNARDRRGKRLLTTCEEFHFPELEKIFIILSYPDFSSNKIINKLMSSGRLDESLKVLSSITELKRQSNNPEDLEIIALEDSIMKIFLVKQDFSKALKTINVILNDAAKIFGTNHVKFIFYISTKGSILSSMGESNEALCILEDAYINLKEIVGREHPLAMEVQFRLIEALHEAGRLRDAFITSKYAVNYSKQTNGLTSPLTLPLLDQSGTLHHEMGQLKEALTLMKFVNQINLDYTDGNDASNLISQAMIFIDMKMHKQALRILNEVLEFKHRRQGTCNREVFSIHLLIGSVHMKQGDMKAALKWHKEALYIGTKTLGSAHPEVLQTTEIISTIHQSLNVINNITEKDLNQTQERLLEAVSQKNVTAVRILLVMGAFVNERNTEGQTPLMLAASLGDINMVRLLLEKGADPTILSEKDNTALHKAVLKNHVKVAAALIDSACHNQRQSFVNAQTSLSGTSALHMASSNGSVEAVECLLGFGAMFDSENSKGQTPLQVTTDSQVAAQLSLVAACFRCVKSSDNAQLMNQLLNKWITSYDTPASLINATDKDGFSLSTLAEINRRKQIIQVLEIFEAAAFFTSVMSI